MTNIELNDFELEAVIELITSNNEYNDQDDVNFWNGIVSKLDPDQKYTDRHKENKKSDSKGQINMGSIRYGGEDGAY